ncbi:MAG: hypothetical protein IKD44_00215 [Lentisphaeria bacterium]|nr:hypothetical protein [Lentisphaeria bacterium]
MRYLIYLFPLVMDIAVSGILFIAAFRFSEAQVPAWMVGSTMAVWALIYTALAFAGGYIIKPEKSHRVLIGSSIGIALVSLGLLIFDGLYTQFLWLILTGSCGALFFTPFQMYMKRYIADNRSGIVRSTALYTGSWSLGFALGPLLFGLVSVKSAFICCIAAGLLMALGFILLELVPKSSPPNDAAVEGKNSADYSRFPDMVLMGYLVGGMGCLVIALIRTMGPFRGVQALGFSKDQMGIIMCLVSFFQSFAGYMLFFSKDWMYKRINGLLLNLAGAAALLGFAFCSSFAGFAVSAVLFGIYAGCFFFFFVFHSLVHPTKSHRYVAGNETIVGATGIVGPLLGGAFITPASSHWIFIAGAFLVFAALAGQQLMLARARCFK